MLLDACRSNSPGVPRHAVPSDAATLFTQHRRSLVEYAASIVGSRAQAEDVVQEAWLRFDVVARQRLLGEPLAYLYRIVRNLALDDRRTTARVTRLLASEPVAVATASSTFSPTPERVALYKDELRLLHEALAELPKRTRVAFEMHRLGGCKLREIAEHLDISLPLAHQLVADGLEHCRTRLGWS
jgi:RNA polymerase sigma-70 factor (ECF subfamily)